MAVEKIDLERVVNDPRYRREVIDRLNAEVRRTDQAPADGATWSEDAKPDPAR
jgi:hypothetical protein